MVVSMDVFRVEMLPLQYELKEAYAEAYALTGSSAYMGGENSSLTSLPTHISRRRHTLTSMTFKSNNS